MVKDYQENREYLVLSLVKKYPLYSLDKLVKELPGISRHSIQRILEKNDLSTVEKRLRLNSSKSFSFKELLKLKLPQISIKSEWLGLIVGKVKDLYPSKGRILIGLFISLFAIVILGYIVRGVTAKAPEITLDQPSDPVTTTKGEKFFVSGKVLPRNSRVTINGSEVALNGNGSFTAVVKVPMGDSTLEVQAESRGKKAQLLRLVSRELTEEELRAQAEEKSVKKKEAVDKAAELERTVNDLLAAKNAGKKGALKVINNHFKEEAGFYRVVGEVVNLGKETVGWVMVTANFYNQAGGIIETKYGFATDFGQVIKPGEKAFFETQTTTKEFFNYSLDLSWEPVVVAGEATSSAGR